MDGKNENINPLVSVIIPCYNYACFIQEAIKGLQEQSYGNWECWIIDDGSTDSTAAVVNQLAKQDSRIKYHYQQNQGQPAARNAGIQKATGSYFQFLDADDLLQPGKLYTQLNFLEQHPETDIVYSDVRYFTEMAPQELFKNRWGGRMEEWMPRISGRGVSVTRELVKQNIFELGCALFRKSAIDATGYFNVAMQGVEDYDYCFRAAAGGLSFVYLPGNNIYCLMRHHPGSFSKSLLFMYKKELILRNSMKQKLKELEDRDVCLLNNMNYNLRLKKWQDLIIDKAIKGYRTHFNTRDLVWLFQHSSFRQNIYFFPRLFKVLVFHSPKKMKLTH